MLLHNVDCLFVEGGLVGMTWECLYNDLLERGSHDNRLVLELADFLLDDVFGGDLRRVEGEVSRYVSLYEDVCSFFNIRYVFHSRAFSSFLESPRGHVKRIIVPKIRRAVDGRFDLPRFYRLINLTVKKCIDTNCRILFQNFVVLSILYNLHSFDVEFVYPNGSWIHLDRRGHQHGGVIPPNFIIRVGDGYFSFFLEAPRPIEWSLPLKSGEPLPLHAAPRPDILIYRGWVENIVDRSSNSIIKSPNFIIECKEVDGWWRSTRPSKGVKHITNGEIESVDAFNVMELYYELYKPDKIFLVSKVKVPRGVKYKLSLRGVETIDNIRLNPIAVRRIVELIL